MQKSRGWDMNITDALSLVRFYLLFRPNGWATVVFTKFIQSKSENDDLVMWYLSA
jgi:hypothetical protein